MAKRRSDEGNSLDRVFTQIDSATPGLHALQDPAEELPSGLPEPLIELYARCDGGRIFVDSLEIVPSNDVSFDNGRWKFAIADEDAIAIDPRGRIWRRDESIDDDVCEGTRLDRWLAAELDALALIFDGNGEFADEVFDDDGEILPIIREQQLRARLKRDAAARPGAARTRCRGGCAQRARAGRRRRSGIRVGVARSRAGFGETRRFDQRD